MASRGWAFLSFHSNDHDVFYRVAVYAPRPHRKGLGLFPLFDSEDFTLPSCVQVPFSSCTTFHIDLKKALDGLGPIYDQVVVDGEEGTFEETLADLKKDPKINLDLRNDLLAHLGNRVHLVTDSTLPTTKNGNRFLLAIPVKDSRIVADDLLRFYRGDDRIRGRTFQERYTIWEMVPAKGNPGAQAKDPGTIPYHAVVVSEKFLYLTNKKDLLETVLRQEQDKDDPRCLAKQEDYQHFLDKVARLGGGKAFSQQFSRLADDLRVVYEMTRRNDLAGVDTLYAQLLLRYLESSRIRLKGELLPEYNQVNHHLGTAGNFGRTTPDGWLIVGFLSRKAR